MTKYYVIGFGGTGSKCLEAYIHLAAAGLSPKDVNVILVDQDQSNGNVAYTKQVMNIYKNSYNDLRTGNNNLGSTPFLNTEFTYPEEGLCWAPLPENRNLKDIFNVNLMKPEIQWLLKVLFQENVVNMRLDKGFLGQSNAGVAVLLSVLLSESGFWKGFMDNVISAVNGGEDVLIFMVASTFGGTGTSGFPTFGRLIHEHLRKEGIETSKLHLGGALLLPYFRFPTGNSNMDGEVAAQSQFFLENTQAAFKHYYRLFKEKDLFKTILRIPEQSGLPFRSNPATDSGPKRPPIPIHSGHSFRSNPATLSHCEFILNL